MDLCSICCRAADDYEPTRLSFGTDANSQAAAFEAQMGIGAPAPRVQVVSAQPVGNPPMNAPRLPGPTPFIPAASAQPANELTMRDRLAQILDYPDQTSPYQMVPANRPGPTPFVAASTQQGIAIFDTRNPGAGPVYQSLSANRPGPTPFAVQYTQHGVTIVDTSNPSARPVYQAPLEGPPGSTPFAQAHTVGGVVATTGHPGLGSGDRRIRSGEQGRTTYPPQAHAPQDDTALRAARANDANDRIDWTTQVDAWRNALSRLTEQTPPGGAGAPFFPPAVLRS
jgi:hypothetical protein